jgi:hypothetical protein
MKKPTLGRTPARHPAVIDLLDGSPTTGIPPVTHTAAPGGTPTIPPRLGSPAPSHSGRCGPGKKTVTVLGAAGLLIAGAATGISQLRGDDSEPAHPTATAVAGANGPTNQNGLPVLNLPTPEHSTEPTDEPAADAQDAQCRADRGDQKSGGGVIAAFNAAYYSQRSGDAARALATPTSSVLPGPELQKVIDTVPVGTSYCLRTVKLSDGVYLADLSVMQPAQPVKRGTQTITTAEIDGRWYVDIFK